MVTFAIFNQWSIRNGDAGISAFRLNIMSRNSSAYKWSPPQDSQDSFPPKMARPIELAPRPIFRTDPFAYKRDKASSILAFGMHALLVILILGLAIGVHSSVATPTTTVESVNLNYTPPPPVLVAKRMGGGGGGGTYQEVKAIQGRPPVIVQPQLAPPQIARISQPKLAIEPSMQLKIPQSNTMPNLGIAQSTQIVLASQGSGSGSGFGEGSGGGIGAGHGTGAGPGSGGGYGGGLMSVGGGVSAPQILHSAEPEFTEEARQANFQGNVSIKLIVDSQGNPQDIRVLHSLGMGLDQKAIEAVRQYKFRPAMYQGHPVSVQMVIEVDFHLH
jgi:TonB family protein